MSGTINTIQKCPVCSGKFEGLDKYGLHCMRCSNSRPTRYYVYFPGLELIYSTPQGNVLDSYERSKRLLSSIQTAYDDAKENENKRFNKDDWKHKKVKHLRFSIKADEILKEYDAKYERKKISRSRYNQAHNFTNKFLKPYFKHIDIREITEENINKFYFSLLDQKYSDCHIRNMLSYLKSILLRVRPENMPKFPSFEVEPKKKKQYLQIDRQMAIAPHIPEKHGYRLAISIMQTTAMRPSELRALQVNDIVENGVIVWKSLTDRLKLKRKNGGEVFYPLPEYLFADLKKHTEGKGPDDFIFSINGKPLGEGRLRKTWNKAVNKAGVKHIEYYQACRHSWASREMKESKMKAIERIQDRLGHMNKQTQKHYVLER